MQRPSTPSDERPDFWQSLLYRWFVQYNPTYLLSATLVLGGVILVSRGLAQQGSVYGGLGVAAIAEVYACALIAGAAILTRIGQRRPGVLLALLAVLYQSDLTLHTETCAFMGRVGAVAALVWLALFAGKLYALARALKVELAPRAIATGMLGAAGLMVGPYVVPRLGAHPAGLTIAVFAFALAALRPRIAATSTVSLDEWGRTVLHRTVIATWSIWAIAFGAHVLFWESEHPIALGYVVVAVVLFRLSTAAREAHVWTGIASLLFLTLLVEPHAFSGCALLVALALVRRAYGHLEAQAIATVPVDAAGTPYRWFVANEGSPQPSAEVFIPVDARGRARLLSGAVANVYLFVWTLGYRGGAWPGHVLALDVVFALALGVLAWRFSSRIPFVPLVGAYGHALMASGLVPRPRSLVDWGTTAISSGFLLLLASVAISYWLETRARREAIPHVGHRPPIS